MNRYDEDAVVALLRESVPAVPDVPDRVALVRHKARSQRATLWTQGLGAVASVLLIVGVAAAVSTPGGRETVEPTSEPIRALSEAFTKEDSVRFEATMTPVGSYTGQAERFHEALTAHVTGAVTKDGEMAVEGDLSFAFMFGDTVGDGESRFRIVDGDFYRSPMKMDFAPKGIEWVQEEGESQVGLADLVRSLKVVDAVVEDVRYVGGATVRGVPVAEYRLTVPEKYLGDEVTVTFALDGDDRLRRIAAEFSYLAFMTQGQSAEEMPLGGNRLPVRVELLLHGYGDDVDIDKPPAARTMTAEQVEREGQDERQAAWAAFEDCVRRAGNEPTAAEECAEELGYPAGMGSLLSGGVVNEHCYAETEPDGTVTTTCSDSASTSGGWTSTGGTPPPPAETASPAP
jgi:hypothetical protein